MELKVNDLGQVLDQLFEVRRRWYNIGLQLKVPVGSLESIKIEFNDPQDQLRETLKSWLQNTEGTTWETLVTTLESRTINESRLAIRLKENYCKEALVKENEEHSEIQHLRQELETRNKQSQEKNQLLEASQLELQQLRQEVAQRDHQVQKSQAKTQQALDHPQQTEEVRQSEIQQLEHKLKERDRQSKEIIKAMQSEIQQFKQELESRDRQLQAKDRQLQEKDEALVARQKEIEELRLEQHAEQVEKSPVTKKRRKNEDLYPQARKQSQAEGTSGIQGKFNWKKLSNVPKWLLNVSSAIMDGKMVYVSDDFQVYAYDLDEMRWILLPECPHKLFSLAVVKGQLTTVGGCDATKRCTNSLLSDIRSSTGIGTEWSAQFPPMPTARIEPAVECNAKALIVAGGYATLSRNYVHTHVEVMDTDTKQWFTVSRKLQRYSEWCTITITSDILYIYACTETTPQIIACFITELLQLRSSQDDIHVWNSISTILADELTIATIRGQLMAINGEKDSNEIYAHLYDPKKNSWKKIGNTPTVPKDDIHDVYVKGFSGIVVLMYRYTNAVTIFIPDFE